MAVPPPIDVYDIEFKTQNKLKLFNVPEESSVFDTIHLLATASSLGLIIVGCQTPELKVLLLQNVVDPTIDSIPIRTIPLPSPPASISLSCDHSMLAVNLAFNGSSVILLYAVRSFLSTNVTIFQNIKISEDNAKASEILWNPVLPGTFSVVLNDGSLSVYNVKEQGFEFHSLSKSEGAKCASWSPKGKQIVVGFSNGKLCQYKPDLKLAKTIQCPPNVYPNPFDIISIQWLSTYQFAAVFLQPTPDASPALNIINAPKTGVPTCINYEDICFSQSGPSQTKVLLTHILPWNLLLVASANSSEIGIMGTKESGETPTWNQYLTLDAVRAELPLTADKRESFPIGLALETGCTHQLVISETTLPVMPMLHILSNDGLLISYNLINTSPNCPSICSPPQPIGDTTGYSEFKLTKIVKVEKSPQQQQPTVQPPISKPTPAIPTADISFVVPSGATSTPTIAQKSKSMFDINTTQSNLFGQQPVSSAFSIAAGNNTVGNKSDQTDPSSNIGAPFGRKTNDQPLSFSGFNVAPNVVIPKTNQQPIQFGGNKAENAPIFASSVVQTPLTIGSVGVGLTAGKNGFDTATATTGSLFGRQSTVENVGQSQPISTRSNDINKPLITVQPNYTVPPDEPKKPVKHQVSANLLTDENDKIIRKMIFEEIACFEKELENSLNKSRTLKIEIGTKDELQTITKKMSELQGFFDEATESTDTLKTEVQQLMQTLNESFSMVAEAKSKHAMCNMKDIFHTPDVGSISQTNRRQLQRLQQLLSTNQVQFEMVRKEVDAQWSTYQSMVDDNKKSRTYVPTLENVYQTLCKQREIVSRQRQKISHLRSKLGIKKNHYMKDAKEENLSVDSLADKLISVTICDQVRTDMARLTDEKLSKLRQTLKGRQIKIIKPKRPDRKDLKSEIVLERKLAYDANAKKLIPKNVTAPTVTVHQKLSRETTVTKTVPPSKPTIVDKNIPQQVGFLPTTIATQSFNIQPKQPSITQTIVDKKDTKPTAIPAFHLGQSSQPLPSFSNTLSFGNTKQSSEPKSISFGTTTSFSFNPTETKATISFGEKSTVPLQENKSTAFSFGNTIGSGLPFGTGSIISPVPNATVQKENKTQPVEKPTTTAKSGKENQAKLEAPKPIFGKAFDLSSITGSPFAVTADNFDGKLDNKPESALKRSNTQPTLIPSTVISFGSITSGTPATFAGFNSSGQKQTEPITIKHPAVSEVKTVVTTEQENLQTTVSISKPFTVGSGVTVTPIIKNVESVAVATSDESAKKSEPSTSASTFSFASFIPSIQPLSTATTSSSDNLLKDLSICSPDDLSAKSPTSGTNIFNMSSFGVATTSTGSIFGKLAISDTTAATTYAAVETVKTTASSTFGSTAVVTTTTSSIFSTPITSTTASTPSVFGKEQIAAGSEFRTSIVAPVTGQSTVSTTTAITTISSPFSSFAISTTTTASSFGFGNMVETVASTTPSLSTASALFSSANASMPKPDQSIFGSASTKNIFGTPTTTSTSVSANQPFGQSVFGGQTAGTNPSSPFGSSIFGSSKPVEQQSSPFGATAVGTPATGANLFGQQQQASSGGSLFGGTSAFGSPQGSVTGSTSSVFGGGSSIGATSPFGGFGGQQQSPGFGSTSAFGNQSTGTSFGSGSFGQTGPSVAQTGFASTTGSSVFGGGSQSTQPAFGAQPVFGGTATFGNATPAFGGGATFGSPKSGGFGAFANMATGNAFQTSPTQQNTLFESLGASDSGMTFGNLAQNTNPTPNAAPPAFGGTSFSSWR